MKLSEIVAAYLADLPAGTVLAQPQVERTLKAAVRFYCGYATLRKHPSEMEVAIAAAQEVTASMDRHTAIDATNAIASAQDFDLTPSEHAVIAPLFRLYAEHENAMNLEASRALGIEVYGRSVSEIEQDIKLYEDDMPRRAFRQPAELI